MTVPIATYRLQLRNGFTFADAAARAPYLADLGISHVYLSPIFRAASGSTHGYDATDFNEVDPLLGGIEGFNDLIEALKRFSLKVIVDFVPNHMATHPDNPWWHDVLEWGRKSLYSRYFDIDWSAPKILLPILGRQYGESLAAHEIKIAFEPKKGAFVAHYFDNWLPLSPGTFGAILLQTQDTALEHLARSFAESGPGRAPALKATLAAVAGSKRDIIEDALRRLNDDPRKIHSILEVQAWRLAYWRTAREMLTYRRFFEISDLVGVRVEEDDVFSDVHRTLLALVRAGKIDGLRIDHTDGLADPLGYLKKLRQATEANPDLYLVVEKILGDEEEVRPEWPTDGTTGYEFIRDVGNLFVASDLTRLDEGYRQFTGVARDYASETLEVKRRTLTFNLASELERLVAMATAIAAADVSTRDFGRDTLRTAIIEVASRFNFYRTYVDSNGSSPADAEVLDSVCRLARSSRRIEDPGAVDFVIALCKERPPSSALQVQAKAFAIRFQQTTGPLMAKAVEDTLFYRFNRLIALNEVGGEPDSLRPGSDQFHAAMLQRRALAPRALTATATHDTKRGEDTRARLYALSGMQDDWCTAVERWSKLLKERAPSPEANAPDRESEWLFYQALAGAWPIDEGGEDGLAERMIEFLIKAGREAKLSTSWTNPDSSYETRLANFVRHALDPPHGFVDDFKREIDPLILAGGALSLVQTVLKVFAPGVPDIYQGTELWDLSLVDPDNRRAVDFEKRQTLLSHLAGDVPLDQRSWRDGSLKLAALRRSLAVRREIDFTFASYEPLQVIGGDQTRVIAFLRRDGDSAFVIIGALASPKHYQQTSSFGFDSTPWRDTKIILPSSVAKHNFVDAFTGTIVPLDEATLEVATALRHLPIAVLQHA